VSIPSALALPPPEERQARAKNGPAVSGHEAEPVGDAIASKIVSLPEQLRRSLTWDQGAEMAQHAQLPPDTGLQVYFSLADGPRPQGSGGGDAADRERAR